MHGEPRSAQGVVKEIKKRARPGHPLNSGANRGDWLYASAVKYHGSWRAAVEAAGYDYEDVWRRPMSADEVTEEIGRPATAGKQLLAADHPKLSRMALRHFGPWRKALSAAGVPEAHLFWTKQRIVDELRRRSDQGKELTTKAVLRANRSLFDAVYRHFESWGALAMAEVRRARRR
jgi:hypothetical protein